MKTTYPSVYQIYYAEHVQNNPQTGKPLDQVFLLHIHKDFKKHILDNFNSLYRLHVNQFTAPVLDSIREALERKTPIIGDFSEGFIDPFGFIVYYFPLPKFPKNTPRVSDYLRDEWQRMVDMMQFLFISLCDYQKWLERERSLKGFMPKALEHTQEVFLLDFKYDFCTLHISHHTLNQLDFLLVPQREANLKKTISRIIGPVTLPGGGSQEVHVMLRNRCIYVAGKSNPDAFVMYMDANEANCFIDGFQICIESHIGPAATMALLAGVTNLLHKIG